MDGNEVMHIIFHIPLFNNPNIQILWKDMSQLQTYALTVTNNIVALKFISDSKIALVLDDCSVSLIIRLKNSNSQHNCD